MGDTGRSRSKASNGGPQKSNAKVRMPRIWCSPHLLAATCASNPRKPRLALKSIARFRRSHANLP